jgi:hypothetical protein
MTHLLDGGHRARTLRAALGTTFLLLAAACSSSTSTSGTKTDGGTDSSGTHSGGGTSISAAGGTAKGAQGEELIVPPGALSSTTTFSLAMASSGFPDPPGGVTFEGAVFAFTPHGTQFAKPATVVIPFTSSAASPVLLQAEEGASSWKTVSITSKTSDALEGEVTSLSFFVSGSMAPADAGEDADAGCSGRACETNADCCSICVSGKCQ